MTTPKSACIISVSDMEITYFAHAGHQAVDSMGFNGAIVFNDLWIFLHIVGLMLFIFSLTTELSIVRLARASAKPDTLKPLLDTVSKSLPIALSIIWITGFLLAWAFIAGEFVYDWLLIVADIYVIVTVLSLLHAWKLRKLVLSGKTPSRGFYAGLSISTILFLTILVLDIFKPSMNIALIVCSVALVIAILAGQIIADHSNKPN